MALQPPLPGFEHERVTLPVASSSIVKVPPPVVGLRVNRDGEGLVGAVIVRFVRGRERGLERDQRGRVRVIGGAVRVERRQRRAGVAHGGLGLGVLGPTRWVRNAGSAIAARSPMIRITTRSSISVKPR